MGEVCKYSMPYVVIKIGRGNSTLLGKEGKTKIGLVNKNI